MNKTTFVLCLIIIMSLLLVGCESTELASQDPEVSDPQYEGLTIEEIATLEKAYKDFTANDMKVFEKIMEKSEKLSPDEFDFYFENITRIDEEMEAFEAKPEPGLEVEPKPEQDGNVEQEIPREYKSALSKADSYVNIMYMSKAGLYEQLVSEYGENFSKEAAQYAIDNVEADWKENALQKAIMYQDSMDMSPNAIYDQLTSEYGEDFTKEEADYAIENLPK